MKWTLIAAVLVGCSGATAVDLSDTQQIIEDAPDEETREKADVCPLIRPVIIALDIEDSCVPKSKDEACEGVICGASRSGCGGFYLCVVEPASACEGCDVASDMMCPIWSPLGYTCQIGIFPIGCIDQGGGKWCCMDF